MFNVKDFGAKGDGKTLDTLAVQAAVDACEEAGGGQVYFPEGTYVLGTVHFKNNVEIHISKGATVLGSMNPEDFDPYEEDSSNTIYQDRSHSYFHHSLFHADSVSDIALTGLGKIDMQSVWEVMPGWERACKIVAFKNCYNVVIRDLTMRNATDLAVYFAGCENVRITGLDLIVHIDGISPDSCKNVVISDCIIDAGDDGIVPKSSFTLGKFKAMENLCISNCVVKSRCNAIKFGTESNTAFINTTITGCTIYDTRYSGIALECIDGALIEGFSVSNISMRNVGNPFMIIVMDRGRGPEGTTVGEIRNISFSNITATGPYVAWEGPTWNYSCHMKNDVTQMPVTTPALIIGQPDSIIKNISLSNIFLSLPGGGCEDWKQNPVPEVRQGYAESVRYGRKPPAYGLLARDVDNLKLMNVEFVTEKEDARDAIYLENVTRFKNI